MAERIGILGGSFNPVHHGHLLLAQEAWYRFELARVLFIPAAHNPLKPEPPQGASDHDRQQMLRLAIEKDARFAVDAQELRQGGVSYTIDTLTRLATLHPGAELYLLVGADAALSLPEWKDIARYREFCTIVACNRPGGTDLSAGLPEALAALDLRWEYMPLHLIDISSSDIRRRIAMGRPVRYYTTDAVAEYIHKQKLYLD